MTCDVLWLLLGDDPDSTPEYVIVRKLAVTPVDLLLLVASLCKNGLRNEPGRIIRQLEPSVGKDSLNFLPSPIRLQFVRKIQTLRYPDDVRIFICPNFPITSDSD